MDNEQSEFQAGDVVRLRSGGPEMTISDPNPTGRPNEVECQWFADEKLESGWFSRAVLVKGRELTGNTDP